MRTAIALLAVLALLATIGSILPQIPQEPRAVMTYILDHPFTGPIFARIGLFDIFSSWPFIITALLMYTSLGAGLAIRIPAAIRRGRAGSSRTRAYWAEVASIVFHASFFLLFAGVVYGKAAGFVGNAAVVEGGSFVEARANYDNLDEGILAPRHAGFQVKVDGFQAAYWPSGAPRDFVSHVTVYDHDRLVERQDIRVNHYLEYDGVKVYQSGYGWAPTLRIQTSDGRVVADGPTIFLGDPQLGNGVVKAPGAGPQGKRLAATALLLPDPQVSGDAISPGTAEPRNPLLLVRLYRGAIPDRAENVYTLDTTGMELRWRGALRLGDTVTTPDGVTLSFTGLKYYTDFALNRDPGIPIVLAAFAIGLSALLVSLYLPALGREERLAPARELTGD